MADHSPADLLRQRLDPLLQRIALIGESKLGAVLVAGLRNAPGDRAVVGDAHDQAALAAQETRGFRHDPPRRAADGRPPMAQGGGPTSKPPFVGERATSGREYRRRKSVCRLIWFACEARRPGIRQSWRIVRTG